MCCTKVSNYTSSLNRDNELDFAINANTLSGCAGGKKIICFEQLQKKNGERFFIRLLNVAGSLINRFLSPHNACVVLC